MYDGDHDIIESPSLVFKPQSAGHYTWSWHVLNANIDKPGKWTFDNGYKNFAHIQKDEDLVFLRAQPEWPEWFAKHQKP